MWNVLSKRVAKGEEHLMVSRTVNIDGALSESGKTFLIGKEKNL